jgi:hypothetical protein
VNPKLIIFVNILKLQPQNQHKITNLHPVDCSKTFNSIDQSDGIIASPCYPSNYPNETVCKYELIGRTNERIQLNFIDFSLTGNHTECYYSDTVEVGARIDN